MLHSEVEHKHADIPGQRLATTAELRFLRNLLLAPGIAFVVLLVLYRRHAKTAPALASDHLRQTLSASIWAGILLIVPTVVIITLGGINSSMTWIILIPYFTTCHAALILLGVFGLTKAMAGKTWRYPLIGWKT